jgi:exodeoxyribonuclease VIII
MTTMSKRTGDKATDDRVRSYPDGTFAWVNADQRENGVYEGVPAKRYHSVDRCSQSRLSRLKRSPAHAKHAMESEGGSPTRAQRVGTATHMAVLEPEQFTTQKALDGKWFCGKHDTDPAEDLSGVHAGLMVSDEDRDRILRMRDAVAEHRAAQAMLMNGGHAELSVLFNHVLNPKDGEPTRELPCKARLDYYTPGGPLVDLKTTQNAAPKAFQREIWERGYYRQLAFYRYALHGRGFGVGPAVIIAAEKWPPYAVAVYELAESALKAGRHEVRNLLPRYAECERTGQWPAYPEEVQELELPHWAWDKL